MATPSDPLDAQLFVPRVLFLALMVSNVMVFTVVTLTVPPPAAPFDPVMFVALFLAAIGSGAAHVILPPRLARQAVPRTALETVEAADPNASVIFREAAPRVRYFADPKATAAAAARVGYTSFIVAMALAESIGIFGAALVTMGCPIEQAVAFPAVAALLMVRVFPTRKRMMAPLEAHYGARMPEPQR